MQPLHRAFRVKENHNRHTYSEERLDAGKKSKRMMWINYKVKRMEITCREEKKWEWKNIEVLI